MPISRKSSFDTAHPNAKRRKIDDSDHIPVDTPSPPPINREGDPFTHDLDDVTSSLPVIEDKVEEGKGRRGEKGTYTSSIYVDAFNLALDTVLKEEDYLFNDEERAAFERYKGLEYEAKHL